jgi:hypothetical protein
MYQGDFFVLLLLFCDDSTPMRQILWIFTEMYDKIFIQFLLFSTQVFCRNQVCYR